MKKLVRLLAVPHELQGAGFRGHIKDSSYLTLIEGFIKKETDFVFEEASGHGPTIAEERADSLLGPGHYLDVDPSRNERPTLGIGETLSGFPIDPMNSNDFCNVHAINEHEKRERLWLQKMTVQPFRKGLLVCGIAHILSFAFRLQTAAVDLEVYDYLPYSKICTRPHT
jgi:hypothetical protein